MILRRLMQSLKEQNWTAIVIEFVLLVLGVFLGMQANNWNEDREQDRRSTEFSNRLKADLRVEIWRFAALNHYYEDVLANANKTLGALEGRTALSDEALLIAAYRATQFTEYRNYRATFDELTSTGNFGLIRDPLLLKLARDIYGNPLYANVKDEGMNSEYRIAFRKLVPIAAQDAVGANCGDRPTPVLDFTSIRRSLDYDCATGLPQPDIDAASKALRANPELASLLRLRIANIKSAIATTMTSDEIVTNLRTLSEKKP